MRIITFILIFNFKCILAITQQVYQNKVIRITLQSFEQRLDSNYVAYFNSSPKNPNIYNFEVIKVAPAIYIDIQITQQETNRLLLNVVDLDGCQFLRNPMVNKVLANFKKQLIGNQHFACPIQPGVYYLENTLSNKTVPPMYPNGKFQLNVRLNLKPRGDAVLDLLWKYRVMKL